MLMGCILFTITENSFESLKNWLRLRHTGEGVVEDVVSHEGITQASAGREQEGRPYTTPKSGHSPYCKLRGQRPGL